MSFNLCLCSGKYSWLIRLFHCGISVGVVSTLLFTDSYLIKLLRDQEGKSSGLLFIISHCISLTLYLYLSYADPGYISQKQNWVALSDEEESDDATEEDALFKRSPTRIKQQGQPEERFRYCIACRIKQPVRTKHCNVCGKCVKKYDHHCPWIDNCIGEDNHPIFVLYMVLEVFILIWTCFIAWNSVSLPYHYNYEWSKWLYKNVWYLLDCIICVISGLPLILLLVFHLYLAFTNTTTWENVARDKITYLNKLDSSFNPFHQGYLANLLQFCCHYNYPESWNYLYHKTCLRKQVNDITCNSNNSLHRNLNDSSGESDIDETMDLTVITNSNSSMSREANELTR